MRIFSWFQSFTGFAAQVCGIGQMSHLVSARRTEDERARNVVLRARKG